MRTKLCLICNNIKDEDNFTAYCSGRRRGKLRHECSACTKHTRAEHRKSSNGLMYNLYSGMLGRVTHGNSSGKYKGLPICTKEEFYNWINTTDYLTLHSNWINSKYTKRLKPSINRKNNNKGYTLDNIEVTTMYNNLREGAYLGLKRRKEIHGY